eukprot:SAG11_NODE_1146_length_5684_cov_59.423277_6_plen_56_part_00
MGTARVVVIWGVLTHPPQIIQKIMLKKNHLVYRGTKFFYSLDQFTTVMQYKNKSS